MIPQSTLYIVGAIGTLSLFFCGLAYKNHKKGKGRLFFLITILSIIAVYLMYRHNDALKSEIGEIPPPKIDWQLLDDRIRRDTSFVTSYRVTIESKVALQRLNVRAEAKSITDLDIEPESGVGSTLLTRKDGDGFRLINLSNPSGNYVLTAKTRAQDSVKIYWEYQ